MNDDVKKCDFAPCKCRPEASQVVMRDNRAFCSERCAETRGCDHNHCNCGDFPEEEPLTPI